MPFCCCFCGKRIPINIRLIEATPDQIIKAQNWRCNDGRSPLKNAIHICNSCRIYDKGGSTPRPINKNKVQEQKCSQKKHRILFTEWYIIIFLFFFLSIFVPGFFFLIVVIFCFFLIFFLS